MDAVADQPKQSRKPKDLFLCFDGTGDWATVDDTNVMKIYKRLDKEAHKVFYSGGVGTLGSPTALSGPKRVFLKLLDLAVATSIRDRVLEGYCFLVQEYEPGDRIFMTGFSRGAFTARVLAALVHNFGLLDRDRINLAPYLWQTISEFRTIEDFFHAAGIIKDNFSRKEQVMIEFLGLFDTVSSVGVFERFKVYPFTDGNPSVRHARHAVSIDEERNGFPELLLKPVPQADGSGLNDIVEIWFPGVHRDVGGGSKKNCGYEQEVLMWIVAELGKFEDLIIDQTPPSPDAKEKHIFVFDPYVFVGLYPMQMFDYRIRRRNQANLSYHNLVHQRYSDQSRNLRLNGASHEKPRPDSGFRWYWPNFKHERQIPENGFKYVDSNNVRVEGAGMTIPLASARNTEDPRYRPLRISDRSSWNLLSKQGVIPDAIGIILGVALSFLIANRGMDTPLRTVPGLPSSWMESWPHNTSLWATAFFFAYLVEQGFRQWLKRQGFGLVDSLTPVVGFVGAGYLLWQNRPWGTLLIGLALGILVMLFSVAGRKPVLRADRAIPYFFVPWFGIILGLWIVPLLWNLVRPLFDVIGRWWFTEAHPLPRDLSPGLDTIAWCLAVFTALMGFAKIVQDRTKMETTAPNLY